LQVNAEQLIEFEFAAFNTAGDALLQHEQKSTFDVLNEQNFLEEQAEVPEPCKATEMLPAPADRGYFGNKT